MRYFILLSVLFAFGGAVALSSCGSSSSSSAVLSLSSLPDASQMVATSSSTTSSLLTGLNSFSAVTGTPSAIADITSSQLSTYFFEGTNLTTLAAKTSGQITAQDQETFWHGLGNCWTISSNRFAMGQMQKNNTSQCYMKNAPNAASGVTVVSGADKIPGGTKSNVFAQTSTSRTVKILVNGSPSGRPEDEGMIVFIKVYGTEDFNVGYRADLWFCTDTVSEPNGLEQISVNTSTGLLTKTEQHNESGSRKFKQTFTATIVDGGNGTFKFDTTKPRTSSAQMYGEWGTGKSEITVDSDATGPTITTKYWNKNTFTPSGGSEQTFENKQWMTSHYTGDTMATIAILDIGYANYNTDGLHDPWQNFGAAEFHSTGYASVATGDNYSAAAAIDFDADSFYSGTLSAPTIDVSGYSCGVTPDTVISMDFDNSVVRAIAESCEAAFDDSTPLCQSDEIQTIQNTMFQVVH